MTCIIKFLQMSMSVNLEPIIVMLWPTASIQMVHSSVNARVDSLETLPIAKVCSTRSSCSSKHEFPEWSILFFPDIDECALGIDNCDETQSCQNSPGSFGCTCRNGYQPSGTTCVGEWNPVLSVWSSEEMNVATYTSVREVSCYSPLRNSLFIHFRYWWVQTRFS